MVAHPRIDVTAEPWRFTETEEISPQLALPGVETIERLLGHGARQPPGDCLAEELRLAQPEIHAVDTDRPGEMGGVAEMTARISDEYKRVEVALQAIRQEGRVPQN